MNSTATPWRDVWTTSEWAYFDRYYAPTPWTSFHEPFRAIGTRLHAYHAVQKNKWSRFPERRQCLAELGRACAGFSSATKVRLRRRGQLARAKSPGGKAFTDPTWVWVDSLRKRSQKKSEYLLRMEQWHRDPRTARYSNRAQMREYLRSKADNRRSGGRRIALAQSGKLEKLDPYHRIIGAEVQDDGKVRSWNLLGAAFAAYLGGGPASEGFRGNPNASFYEWLEYSSFCLGTPHLTPGAEAYKVGRSIERARYLMDEDGCDLDIDCGLMQTREIHRYNPTTDPDARTRVLLSTADRGSSGEGEPNANAFVWTAEGHLLVLPDRRDSGHRHSSMTNGRKVRCAGMMVAEDGKIVHLEDQSGHYCPTVQSFYYFCCWLRDRGVLATDAEILIKWSQEPGVPNGEYNVWDFLNLPLMTKYPPAESVPYWNPGPGQGAVPSSSGMPAPPRARRSDGWVEL